MPGLCPEYFYRSGKSIPIIREEPFYLHTEFTHSFTVGTAAIPGIPKSPVMTEVTVFSDGSIHLKTYIRWPWDKEILNVRGYKNVREFEENESAYSLLISTLESRNLIPHWWGA